VRNLRLQFYILIATCLPQEKRVTCLSALRAVLMNDYDKNQEGRLLWPQICRQSARVVEMKVKKGTSMPILPLEPYTFPENLFDLPEGIDLENGRWWVLHTRPRAEKTLARRLLGRRMPFFLPLYKRQWRSNARSFNAYLPLFPGYVFLFGDGQARIHALETNLVARVLHAEDQLQLQGDLLQVHQLMASGVSLAPEECLQPGTFVEIVSGPLSGVEGKILRRNNKSRFFVEVRFLQQGVSVDIEGWMIRPLKKSCEISIGA